MEEKITRSLSISSFNDTTGNIFISINNQTAEITINEAAKLKTVIEAIIFEKINLY